MVFFFIIENFEEELVFWCGFYDFGIDMELMDDEEIV